MREEFQMAGDRLGESTLALLLLGALLGCTSSVALQSMPEPIPTGNSTAIAPNVIVTDIKTATPIATVPITPSVTRSSKVDLLTPSRIITRGPSTPTPSGAIVRRSLEPENQRIKLYNQVEEEIAVGVFISDTIGHQTKIFALPNDSVVSFFGGIASATWSRDGKRILIAHSARGFLSALKIVNSDGSNLQDITPPGAGFVSYATWSPDGNRIAFHSEINGQGCVFVIGSGGGQPQKVNRCEFQDNPLYWSEDGKYVLVHFTGQKNGPSASFNVLDVDGDQRIPISQAAGRYFDESYHPWRLINRQNCTGASVRGIYNWSNFRDCQ